MSSSMILHKGAREVTLQELQEVPTPPPVNRHYPIPFPRVLQITLDNLEAAGFEPTRQKLALHKESRFFATIDTRSTLVHGVTLAIAIRASHDTSLAMGFVCGNRTFCCDNLSMSSDLSLSIKKRHTRHGEDRFMQAQAVLIREKLPHFAQNEAARIKQFQRKEVTTTEAESLILRSHEQGLLSTRHLLRVLKEFRTPSFEEFTEHGLSYWRLENAYTTILGEVAQRTPALYAKQCIGIQGLLSQAAGVRPQETVQALSA